MLPELLDFQAGPPRAKRPCWRGAAPWRTQAVGTASPARSHRGKTGRRQHPKPWKVPRGPPGLPLPHAHPHERAHTAAAAWPWARSAGARRGREGSLHSREASTRSAANFRRQPSGRAGRGPTFSRTASRRRHGVGHGTRHVREGPGPARPEGKEPRRPDRRGWAAARPPGLFPGCLRGRGGADPSAEEGGPGDTYFVFRTLSPWASELDKSQPAPGRDK